MLITHYQQGDRCTEDGYKMVRRSEQLDVLSVVRLNCTSTNTVWFTFNVTTIDDDGKIIHITLLQWPIPLGKDAMYLDLGTFLSF